MAAELEMIEIFNAVQKQARYVGCPGLQCCCSLRVNTGDIVWLRPMG